MGRSANAEQNTALIAHAGPGDFLKMIRIESFLFEIKCASHNERDIIARVTGNAKL